VSAYLVVVLSSGTELYYLTSKSEQARKQASKVSLGTRSTSRKAHMRKVHGATYIHIYIHIFTHTHHSPTLGAHIHAHGFWVGMGAMSLFMGRHGWASVLCIPASSSNLESNFSDAGNMLTKKRSGPKPGTVYDFLFVRSNQDLV
jgi:hypothetical protein